MLAPVLFCACHAPVPEHAPASDIPFAYRASDFFAIHKEAVRVICTLLPRTQEFDFTWARYDQCHKVSVEQFFPGFEALVMEVPEQFGTQVVLGGRDKATGWMRIIRFDLDGAADPNFANYVVCDRIYRGFHPPQALNPYAEGLERTWMIESVTGDIHLVNLFVGDHQRVIEGSRDPKLRRCSYLYLERFTVTREGVSAPEVWVTCSAVPHQLDVRYGNGATVVFYDAYSSTIDP